MTVLVPLFCLEAAAVVPDDAVDPDDAVVAAAVVVVGALATAPSMALVTPLVASSFWVRTVFLESLSPGSSTGWK